MAIFSSIFGSNRERILGVDIGTSAIKIVELARVNRTLEVQNYGEAKTKEYLATLKEALEKQTMEQQISDLLGEALKEAGVRTREAVLSIPVFASFSTTLSFPATMREEELTKAVPYEAKSHVPLPLAEVEIDWTVLTPPQTAAASPQMTREVLIVAVPKEMVEKYKRIAERAAITLVAVEIETFSLARVVGACEPSAVVVDIGTSTTSLTIVEEGAVRLSHNIEIAGSEFNRILAQGFRISQERAEELKKQEGILERTAPGVRNVLLPFVDRLVVEAERLLAVYERKTNRTIAKIILSGGSSRLPGLMEYMSAKLKRPAASVEPFSLISYPKQLTPILPELNSMFAVAVGLAMRELA